MKLLWLRNEHSKEVAALRTVLAQALGRDAVLFPGLSSGQTLDANVEAALRAWQAGVGLVADGVLGPRCLELLGLARWPLLAPPLEQGLTLALVRPLFPATKPANIDRYLPYVSAALRAVGLLDRPMLLAALGTIKAETEGFLPISEYPSQFNTPPGAAPFSAYDGRLGNKQAGDGARFKGRGFVQLTGRANYAKYGELLGVDLCAQPDLANAPEVAAVLLAGYLAQCADAMREALAAGNLRAARKLVNGGSHGLDRFSSVFEIAAATWPGELIAPAGRRRGAAARSARAAPARPTIAPASTPARRLTVRQDPSDLRDLPYTPPPLSLPDRFPSDAEIKTLLPAYVRLGLILDQGQEGACTGFGLACVVNYLRWRRQGLPKRMASVSPRMLYNFARRYDEYAGEDYDGSSCRGALKGWYHHGVCLEEDWPYADPSARPRYGYAERAAQNTLGVYYRIQLKSITDLQAALQQVGAVYVSAYTHAGWQDLPTRRSAPTRHADLPLIPFDGRPSRVDGHAFALLGFNDLGFVVQNSWGPAWGRGGFAVLSYADWLANGMDAWVVATGVPGVVSGRLGVATDAQGRAGAGASRPAWWSQEQAYQHSVVLGNDGRVARYLTEDELSRTLLHQVAGLPDRWFRSRPKDEPRRLVIYAHGGLNSEADAIQRARAMGRHFLGNGCYPLFMVWKTGLQESLANILEQAWQRQGPKAAGLGDWLVEKSDLLIEKTIGRPLARPIWSEMKENAELDFASGRGGDLLITALQKLRDSWGDALELHLVGHSAGSILLGHLLSALARRQLSGLARSVHLYAPACTVAFANRHYAPQQDLMKQLYIDLLSDRVERNDNTAAIYRKSLLYLVSNALEVDLRTPILGLENVFVEDYAGWDGSSSTGEALRAWRAAAAQAGLNRGDQLQVLDADKMLSARQPAQFINAAHGGFDNDVEVVTRTLTRILGGVPEQPVDDLRGF